MIETVDFCYYFVILVSHAERYITSGNLQLGLSDHDLVFVVKKNSTPKATLY